MDALPLSANGKIDRLALARIDVPLFQGSGEYIAPRNETQKKLAEVWRELLPVSRVGTHDNFFELGGNSLLAGLAMVRVRHLFKVQASITWLFDAPTVSALAGRIESEIVQGHSIDEPPLVPVSREQPSSLSFSQQRLWFLDQLDPGNSAYNLAHAFEIKGPLDRGALRQSLNAVMARHEVLRTRFISNNGEPFQQMDLPAEVDWQVIDLENLAPEELAGETQRVLAQESRRPFNLSQGPVLRATLLGLGASIYVLLLTMHHIVSDGWSAGILVSELGEFYRMFVSGGEASLSQLQIQFADFAVWQRECLLGGLFDSQLDYWRQNLSDAPLLLALPTDLKRTSSQTYRGAKAALRLPVELAGELRSLSLSHNTTLFMTLLAGFNLMLARYSGQNDIVVGSPVAGRNRVEAEPLIGFFVNTVALRTKLSHDETVSDLLANVRSTALDAYANRDVPFEKLVSELQHDRNPEHNPIFQVMFALKEGHDPVPALEGLSVTSRELEADTSKFDLTLEATDSPDGLEISISYRTDLFKPESIDCMLSDYCTLLEAFVANPQQRLHELPPLTWKPKYLPEPLPATEIGTSTPIYVPPSTPIEEKLVSIWTEVLGIDRIGVHDNFFALGGHSLMATQVIARVRSTFNYELPLRRLFEAPTISALARTICESHAGTTEDEELAALLAELDELSDDEAREKLEEETV
jgi:acyl carrier protein